MEDTKLEAKKLKEEIEETEDEVMNRFKLFKNFDVISNPPNDHHFIQLKRCAKQQLYIGSVLAKTINKEWKILKTCLPNLIFVRGYETRIDLMRAMIVGPEHTPYHNGLFFFDILFPINYPDDPPKVFFLSHGPDMNPNLYDNGFVCLSLLNTWIGSKEEKWNPKQSTMLQLLVSIQGLVLNDQPYFNEPVRIYIFNESRSSSYNIDVAAQTNEAMINTLALPPKDFEDFVAGHFRMQANTILLNCKDRIHGSNYSMRQLFMRLEKSFEKNGSHCEHHLDQLNIEEDSHFVTKIFNKLKNLMGFGS